MANTNKKITVGLKIDDKDLKNVRDSLNSLSKMGLTELQIINPRSTQAAREELQKIKTAVNDVNSALTASYNTQFSTIDIAKFRTEIEKSQGGIKNLAETMNNAGTAGKNAFSDMLSMLLTAQGAVKQTNKLLDSMAETFFNTVKWSISSSILNAFTGTIQKAWSYTQKLDESLNNIRIVTSKSNEEMEKFAKTANKVAKSLGASTTSYTNAALIYYQQGLSEKDVSARTNVTVKAANVTGQSAAEVSEQLTAVWNGYKVVAEEAELYVDKLAAVAATTAADLEELSTGMSKVASAANAMGVDIDQLSAQLSTIVSVTRQDASVVGTALKTIYSRMGDLKVDGVDEFGVSLGDVSGQLAQMGIQVLDQSGNLRDMGTVIEEVAAKWGTWTDAQQQAAAVAIAGKRQYNNLIALFENWDMYEGALATSQGANGTLQKQNEIYLDSIAAKLNKLKTASEGLFDSLIDSESTKNIIEALTKIVEHVDYLVKSLGGLGHVLQLTGGLMTKVFSNQITQRVSGLFSNKHVKNFNASQNQALTELFPQIGTMDQSKMTDGQRQAIALKEEQLRISKLLTQEEFDRYNTTIQAVLEQEKITRELEDQVNLQQKEIIGIAGTGLSGSEKAQAQSKVANLNATEKAQFYRSRAKESRVGVTMSVANQDELDLLMEMSPLLQKNRDAYQKLKEEQKDFNSLLKASRKLLAENAEDLDDSADAAERLAEAQKHAANSTETLNKEQEQMRKAAHTKEMIEQWTNLVGTLTTVASAFATVGNAIKILDDDTLSTKEKVLQFATAIASAALTITLTVISAVRAIKTPIVEGMSQIQVEAVKTQAAFGWISIVITAIIALVGGIAILISNLPKQQSAYEKASEAAQKAAESAENAAQKVKDLRAEYDALLSSVSDYEEAANALDGLTAGTEELEAAVRKVNTQVMDLINQYPELVAGFQVADGVYSINTDILKTFQKQQLQKKFGAMAISAALNINAAKAKKVENQAGAKENIKSSTDKLGSRVVTIGEGDSARDIFIDFSKVTQEGYLNDERMEALNKLTQDSDEVISDAAKTVQTAVAENNKILETQNSLIKANTRAIQDSIAQKHGYDTEVFDWFTKDISDDKEDPAYAITKDKINSTPISTRNKSKDLSADRFQSRISKTNEGLAAIQELFIKNTGKAVRSKGGRQEIASIILSSLKNIYPSSGYSISVDSESVPIDVKDLGQTKVKINGTEMTLEEALEGAKIAGMEAAMTSDDVVGDLNKVIEAGKEEYNYAAAYFVSGTDPSNWSSASIANFNEIAGYTGLGDDYATNVQIGKDNFISRIIDTYTGYGGFTRDEIINSYSHFQDADFERLYATKEAANKSGNLSSLQSVLDSYADDPEALLKVAGVAASIDWADERQVADFMWGYTAEVQEKVRKKELDYFKNINRELDKLNTQLERAVGLEKLSLLSQKKEQEELALAQAQSEAIREKETFDNYITMQGYGSLLNADGSLNVTALNDRIAKLDPKKDEDAAEIERLNKVSTYWDDFVNKETLVQESIDNIIDSQIKSFKYWREFQDQITEALKQWEDISSSLKTSLSDYNKNATIASVNKSLLNISRSETDFYTALSDLEKISTGAMHQYYSEGVTTTYTSSQFEDYKESFSKIMEILSTRQQEVDNLYNGYLNLQGEILKTYDKEIQKLESLNSILQSSVDLMKLAKVDSISIAQSFEAMTENSRDQFSLAQQELAAFQNQFDSLSEDAPDAWRDEIINNLTEAGENVLKKGQEYYTAIANQFANKLSGLFDTLVKIEGASTLAGVTEEWNFALANDSRYLDSVNEAYAMDNLDRKFKEAIDATDSIYAQNKLLAKQTELQEKLTDIKEEQGKLTQADLDRANAEYELTLKQIALEEAQQTTNQMKLTRDAMGNYTYQYVADQDAIEKAEKELADAENKLYNMDKDRTKTLVSEYYSTMSEANTQIAEAMAANDQERVERLKEYYFGNNGILKGIQTELRMSSDSLEDIYDTFTDSILQQNLQTASQNISTAISSTSSAMGTLSSSISSLFEEDGALGQLPDQIADNISTSIDTSQLTEKAELIADQLPDILSITSQLQETLGGDQGFVAKFKTWSEAVTNGTDSAGKILAMLQDPNSAPYVTVTNPGTASISTDSSGPNPSDVQ